mmetsp:Transcript_2026/g.2219  ORF Transcript_2026/g.2219 Transcript_2026/m.2219 type:complete len:92 (+) Transcript_2026:423-698(+)
MMRTKSTRYSTIKKLPCYGTRLLSHKKEIPFLFLAASRRMSRRGAKEEQGKEYHETIVQKGTYAYNEWWFGTGIGIDAEDTTHTAHVGSSC